MPRRSMASSATATPPGGTTPTPSTAPSTRPSTSAESLQDQGAGCDAVCSLPLLRPGSESRGRREQPRRGGGVTDLHSILHRNRQRLLPTFEPCPFCCPAGSLHHQSSRRQHLVPRRRCQQKERSYSLQLC